MGIMSNTTMKDFLKGFGIIVLAGVLLIGMMFFAPYIASLIKNGVPRRDLGGRHDASPPTAPKKTTAELVAEAHSRSQNIKALYMTAEVANDGGAGATRLRNHLIALADTTEINALVIDVKEVCGPEYDEKDLKKLLDTLHQKNIWAIGRIVTFKDASQREVHPEWYLTRKNPKKVGDGACARKDYLTIKNPAGANTQSILWRDNKGGYWMDPASPGTRDYIVGFAKKMSDLGFDELQFDYVRFPSDGDVSQALYPAWDGTIAKHDVLKNFFAYLQKNLKAYRPDLMLSADLFGYVADQGEDKTIGQRLADIAPSFDYVSFMVYPSHYYAGLILPPDPTRKLPAVNYNVNEARTHPDVVVGRSLLAALNFFPGAMASSTASSTPAQSAPKPANALLRPWLEDFFHEADRLAGRPSGAAKVRLQIDAAEKSGGHGWLLWNASNIYSESALKKEYPHASIE